MLSDQSVRRKREKIQEKEGCFKEEQANKTMFVRRQALLALLWAATTTNTSPFSSRFSTSVLVAASTTTKHTAAFSVVPGQRHEWQPRKAVSSSSSIATATATRTQYNQLQTKRGRSSSTTTTQNTKYPFLSTLLSAGPPNKEEVDPGVVEGTDLQIVKYPHPALRAENKEISAEQLKTDEEYKKEVTELARGMLKVMYAAEGVGLAAPQVGENVRLMVYNPTGDSKKWLEETILVNPKIVEFSEGKDVETEGCLSFPGMNGPVQRSKWIKVQATNLKGKPIKKKFTGWEARIFQHEYDHLDGTVYIDHLQEDAREEVQPRLNELIEEYGEGGAL